MSWTTTTATAANFTGSISGTTLTVTAPATNACQPGYILNGAGITTTTVVKQLTGTQNGAGTYEVTVSQTVASTTITPTIRTHTQTGTDTGWSGLLGLAGVTKIFGAVGIIWQVDSARLVINGTFTCSPRSEWPYFTNSPFLEISTGTSSIVTIAGNSTGSGGLTDYTTSPFMHTTRSGSGYNGSNVASFYVNGVLNWSGGTHLSDGPVYLNSTSTVTIDNAYATWIGGAQNSFYIATTNITFNGPLYCTGKRLAPLVTALTLTGFAPRNTAAGLDGGNANQYLTLVDFQPYNCGIDIYQRNYNGRIMYGSSKGMYTVVQNPLLSGTGWQGVALLLRNVTHTAADPSGATIVGAKVYSIPTNDGNRADLSAFGPALPIFNFTNAPAQNWITTAGGISTTQAVKLKGWWVNNTTTPANSSTVTRYTLGGDDTATYIFYACSYNHFLANNRVGLNGIGTFTNAFTLVADSSITQSVMATVASYTSIATAAQLYDYAKYYLYTNFAGQTSVYASRSGLNIDAGAYDVSLSPSAASVFAVVGNAMTIKSTSFADSITTTGNITNNAVVSGTLSTGSGVITSLASDVASVVLSGSGRWDTQAPCVAQGGSAASGTTVRITAATSDAVANFQAFDFNASSTFENTSGQPITLLLSVGQTAPTLLPTSGTITLSTPIYNATATILANTRVQLYNVTTSTELDNVFVSGISYSKALPTGVTNGDTLRLRACKKGYEEAESFAVWSSGATFLIAQAVSAAYASWGIDGETVTEYALDGTNLQIDANDVDGQTLKVRLGAFYSYAITTELGIRNFFGAVTFLSAAQIRVNVDKVNLLIDNINATQSLLFTDLSVRLYRSDGTSIIAPTSYSIQNDYNGVPDVVGGIPSAEENATAVLLAASTSPIAANSKRINDAVVYGNGTEANLWRGTP